MVVENRMKKILFIYTTYSTFVKTDYEILSSQHAVTQYQFKPVKGLLKTAAQFLKQLVFLLVNIWKFDAVFIWFADYHSFLPVLFAKITNKKSFVVVGGYDVARLPELSYGIFLSKVRGFCAIYSMKKCSLNLSVSNYVHRKVKWIAKDSKSILVYNCVNIPDTHSTIIPKENLVITVGFINSERTFYIKGIDTFIEVAHLLPDLRFLAIGITKELPQELLQNLPSNLEFVENVNHEELHSYYKRAKIYCQFSRSESFGVSIVEAMSFGCIPIVTNVGGMPELVGKKGKVVKRDPEHISKLLAETVLNSPNTDFEKNLNKGDFSIATRKEKILSLIG